MCVPFYPFSTFLFLHLPSVFPGLCGVIEQKDEGGQQPDSACGAQTQPGHAGLCEYDGFIQYCFLLSPTKATCYICCSRCLKTLSHWEYLRCTCSLLLCDHLGDHASLSHILHLPFADKTIFPGTLIMCSTYLCDLGQKCMKHTHSFVCKYYLMQVCSVSDGSCSSEQYHH